MFDIFSNNFIFIAQANWQHKGCVKCTAFHKERVFFRGNVFEADASQVFSIGLYLNYKRTFTRYALYNFCLKDNLNLNVKQGDEVLQSRIGGLLLQSQSFTDWYGLLSLSFPSPLCPSTGWWGGCTPGIDASLEERHDEEENGRREVSNEAVRYLVYLLYSREISLCSLFFAIMCLFTKKLLEIRTWSSCSTILCTVICFSFFSYCLYFGLYRTT